MENGVFVKVFLNYKSAKKYFDDTVKERKKNDHLFVDLEDTVYALTEMVVTVRTTLTFPLKNKK